LPGQTGWNRVNPAGLPITPDQAHPGNGAVPPVENPELMVPEEMIPIEIP
jgi:hypothetical protein